MNEKEVPGVWLISTVNARSLNPKLTETNTSYLHVVLHLSSGADTVNAVESHLMAYSLIPYTSMYMMLLYNSKICYTDRVFLNDLHLHQI